MLHVGERKSEGERRSTIVIIMLHIGERKSEWERSSTIVRGERKNIYYFSFLLVILLLV